MYAVLGNMANFDTVHNKIVGYCMLLLWNHNKSKHINVSLYSRLYVQYDSYISCPSRTYLQVFLPWYCGGEGPRQWGSADVIPVKKRTPQN
jgi:hypothetical protein